MTPYPKLEKEMFSSKLFRSHFIPEQGHPGFIFSSVRYPVPCVYRKYLCLFLGSIFYHGKSGKKLPRWIHLPTKGGLQWKKSLCSVLKLPPWKLTWSWKTTVGRYISYWTWGFSNVMLVFRSVCFESLRFKNIRIDLKVPSELNALVLPT